MPDLFHQHNNSQWTMYPGRNASPFKCHDYKGEMPVYVDIFASAARAPLTPQKPPSLPQKPCWSPWLLLKHLKSAEAPQPRRIAPFEIICGVICTGTVILQEIPCQIQKGRKGNQCSLIVLMKVIDINDKPNVCSSKTTYELSICRSSPLLEVISLPG